MKNDKLIKYDMQIKSDEELTRLKKIKFLYDNGEIDEDDISDEDIDSLIELYKKETEEFNNDTEKRRQHIAKMLKDLKN